MRVRLVERRLAPKLHDRVHLGLTARILIGLPRMLKSPQVRAFQTRRSEPGRAQTNGSDRPPILPSEHMFAFICQVQLALDALDRLVETLEEHGSLSAVEAARSLFATTSISEGLACSLLAEVTAGDGRVVCAGATVSLAGRRADPLLEEAEFVVFDLETTGLSAEHKPHL